MTFFNWMKMRELSFVVLSDVSILLAYISECNGRCNYVFYILFKQFWTHCDMGAACKEKTVCFSHECTFYLR